MNSGDPPKYTVDEIVTQIVAAKNKGTPMKAEGEQQIRTDPQVVKLILAGAQAQGIKFVENDLGAVIMILGKDSRVSDGVRSLLLAFKGPIKRLLEEDKKNAIEEAEEILRSLL